MSATVTATRSRMPYLVLAGIALAIAAGLWTSGLGADILNYRKDIVYLTKQHVVLVAVSGSAAIVLGIAIGIWLSRPWMARWAEGALQAVNMVTWIATLLPIIRNTYEGIRAVPAHLIDAARGMGMGPSAVLRRVELPNALFVIFAGVRTAMAVNVGTAPIAFLIGGGGLGELIFTGIDLQEHGMMLAGAIPTALLALVVDFLFGQAQYWLVPRGVNPLRNVY